MISRAVEELQYLTGDLSLEITNITEGSVRLTVDLSARAQSVLEGLWRNGKLREICGFEVVTAIDAQKIREEPPLQIPRIARAELQVGDKSLVSYGLDLSLSSIFIVTEWRAPIGAQVLVSLSFPHILEAIRLVARIREIRATGEPGNPG